MTPWNEDATEQDCLAAASECPWSSADECARAQERRVRENYSSWPCRTHGGWCEVCEQFRPVIVPARFVEALVCEDCAATEPEIEEETR